ncbi:hypothetical protein DE146DRAFT_758170 [Phaeosphaeria sp. MPI-PUGE-AT-0046c]|nr:hypothetical protein DE146DRAFT_758170 [Phaeosphaeria sp. MPI-PUGE-AT-0046c]
MSNASAPYRHNQEEEVEEIRPGRRFGYGHWLQPIINANDRADSVSEDQCAPVSPSPPQRRGRGRPPVTKAPNDSAIEKRRAQVREAQRSYQKRKDTATALDKRRADELLQLLFDLSSHVEPLLQAASTGGHMYRNDEVSKNIQRLWTTYDIIINNECVKPELHMFQVKNSQRLASHHTKSNYQVVTTENVPDGQSGSSEAAVTRKRITPFDPSGLNFELVRSEATTQTQAGFIESDVSKSSVGEVLPNKLPYSFDPSGLNFELVRFGETTVMSSFQRSAAADEYMGGKNIFEIVQERQAAMKEADRQNARPT